MDHEERYLEAVTAAEAEVSRVLVTLLFTDIVGSTERAAELGDRAWMRLVEAHHATVRELFTRFDGREVDCAGDGFFATFDTASSAIGCGDAITSSVRPLGLEVRAGLHTGECEHRGGRFRGIAVHTAARLARLAEPGEVLVTATVRDVVAGSGIRFEDRGSRTLKGVPGCGSCTPSTVGSRSTRRSLRRAERWLALAGPDGGRARGPPRTPGARTVRNG